VHLSDAVAIHVGTELTVSGPVHLRLRDGSRLVGIDFPILRLIFSCLISVCRVVGFHGVICLKVRSSLIKTAHLTTAERPLLLEYRWDISPVVARVGRAGL